MLRAVNEPVYLLPEIILKVCSYLTLKQIMDLSIVDKSFHQLITGNSHLTNGFWEYLVQVHFPHLYQKIADKSNLRWFSKFINLYSCEYEHLPNSMKFLFSLFKSNNFEILKTRKTSLFFMEIEDQSNISLIEWARKKCSQDVLDYFYAKLEKPTVSSTNKKPYLLTHALAWRQSMVIANELLSSWSEGDWQKNALGIFHEAIKFDRLDVVDFLLIRRLSLLNERCILGDCALILAAKKNHIFILRYLLNQSGIDLNTSDIKGKTALHHAAELGCSEIAEILLNKGADVLCRMKEARYLPIHLAALNNHLGIIKILLHHHPHLLNQVDKYSQTSLVWAAASGHLSVVEYLLQQKEVIIDQRASNFLSGEWNDATALHYAAWKGHAEVVEALLTAGASAEPGCINFRGFQPIHFAVMSNKVEVVEKFLVYSPALIHSSTRNGETPIMLAVKYGCDAIVEFLLTYQLYDYDKEAALRLAVEIGNRRCIYFLIESFGAVGAKQYSFDDERNIIGLVSSIFNYINFLEKQAARKHSSHISKSLFSFHKNYSSISSRLEMANTLLNLLMNKMCDESAIKDLSKINKTRDSELITLHSVFCVYFRGLLSNANIASSQAKLKVDHL